MSDEICYTISLTCGFIINFIHFAHMSNETDGSVVLILLPFEINVRWQVLQSVQVELKSDVLGLSHSTTHFTNNVIILTLLHIKGN